MRKISSKHISRFMWTLGTPGWKFR